ncbi:hypothetical protein [Rhodococcus sp. 14-1411-2a]|nr:hypothetical protein [Rhodococcus sp. 14-1411-2a]
METVRIETALYDDVVVEYSNVAISAFYVSSRDVRITFSRI